MATFSMGSKSQTAKAKAKAEAEAKAAAAAAAATAAVYSPEAYKANDIGEYRTRFPEETKGFTDQKLFEIVLSTEDDMEDDAWRSLFIARGNPNAVDGDALALNAKHLGEKASTVLIQTIERLAKAREDWQGGPIYTLLSLRASYEEHELDLFARPGSESGHNPDRFTITTFKGDKKGSKKTTFYRQFVLGTSAGAAIVERLDWLDRAADKGAIKEGIPEDILEMSPHQRDSHRSFLENRLNTMTQAYKKAMELHFKLSAVNAYAPNIVACPIWAEDKSPDDVDEIWQAEVVATNRPIAVWLQEEGKPITKWEDFSIAEFLKLNPAKATEKGGGFKNLIESGATKKAPGSAPPAATTDTTIKTVDKSLAVIVEYHRYLLEIMSAPDGADYGKMLQTITKADADEYVTSFVELKNALVDICKNNKLDQRYIKMKEQGSPLVTAPDKAAAK